MKFQVNRDVFADAVSFAVKLLPQRTTLPILSGVLLRAEGDTLTLSSFDYEVSAQTAITADIEEGGTVLVSGRLLSEIASRLPNAPVQFTTEDNKIAVRCGSARFTLSSMPVEEYPSLPVVDGPAGVLPGDAFSDAVGQVSVAASRDDVTPVITGVQLEIAENRLSLVATDRYRVAVREIDWESSAVAEGVTALVPARTLSELGKIFGHSGQIEVTIVTGGDRELIAFSADKKTVTSLLIKGNFPPVRRLFPEQTDHFAVVATAELIEAVRRVSLVLDRAAPLRFTFSADGVGMEASGSEQARASETVDAALTGEDVTLGLNPQYLLEALGAVRSDYTRITFTSSENANKLSPILVTAQTSADSADSGAFRYLLQPNLLLR